jgi:hypothetical protein
VSSGVKAQTSLEMLEAAMAPIVESIEIARTPEDVYAYLDRLERHGEWQEAIVSSKTDTDGPVRVGTRATDPRRVPSRSPAGRGPG